MLMLLAVISVDTASAVVVKHLGFDTDGLLPSGDSEITYLAPSGNVETDVFSVSGGILTGNNMTNSQVVKYTYPGDMYGAWPTNGGISPTAPWMAEMRVRVLSQTSGHTAGSFMMWNGSHRFHIGFTLTGVRVNRSGPVSYVDYPCDTSQWHVLRMWGTGGLFFSASVDGVLFAENQGGVNDADVLNGFFLTVNAHAQGAHVEWDYVRFESGESAIAVDEVSFGRVKALYH